MYNPGPVPVRLEDLPKYLDRELQKLATAFQVSTVSMINLSPTHRVPVRPREGDVYNADGTNWNPGGGAGLYQYLGSAWVKL